MKLCGTNEPMAVDHPSLTGVPLISRLLNAVSTWRNKMAGSYELICRSTISHHLESDNGMVEIASVDFE
jgi:hypothetical protein